MRWQCCLLPAVRRVPCTHGLHGHRQHAMPAVVRHLQKGPIHGAPRLLWPRLVSCEVPEQSYGISCDTHVAVEHHLTASWQRRPCILLQHAACAADQQCRMLLRRLGTAAASYTLQHLTVSGACSRQSADRSVFTTAGRTRCSRRWWGGPSHTTCAWCTRSRTARSPSGRTRGARCEVCPCHAPTL